MLELVLEPVPSNDRLASVARYAAGYSAMGAVDSDTCRLVLGQLQSQDAVRPAKIHGRLIGSRAHVTFSSRTVEQRWAGLLGDHVWELYVPNTRARRAKRPLAPTLASAAAGPVLRRRVE
jgi:hypothetical protein